jgi:hypothetical protein
VTALGLATAALLAAAAIPEATAEAPAAPVYPVAPAEGPDVELHVPRAEVAKLSLDVVNLQARLDVDTSVADLVRIRAGVVATVEKLKAELEGVSAETHLVVRLNRVSDVLQRALGAIDENPQLAGTPFAAAPAAAAPAPASFVPASPPPAGGGVVAATEARPSPSKPNAE